MKKIATIWKVGDISIATKMLTVKAMIFPGGWF